jgi:hypothetical protein
MKKAIASAIALLKKAEKTTSPATAKKDVLAAIGILEKALQKKSGDGGDDPKP